MRTEQGKNKQPQREGRWGDFDRQLWEMPPIAAIISHPSENNTSDTMLVRVRTSVSPCSCQPLQQNALVRNGVNVFLHKSSTKMFMWIILVQIFINNGYFFECCIFNILAECWSYLVSEITTKKNWLLWECKHLFSGLNLVFCFLAGKIVQNNLIIKVLQQQINYKI